MKVGIVINTLHIPLKIKSVFSQTNYVNKYYRIKIDESIIFVETYYYNIIPEKIIDFLKLTEKKYGENYKVYISCKINTKRIFLQQLISNRLDRINIIVLDSIKYNRILAKAKYLFTDKYFTLKYVKKKGQIITNIFDENILDNAHNNIDLVGNIVRNLLFSDFVVCRGKDNKIKNLIKTYALEGVFKGTIIRETSFEKILSLVIEEKNDCDVIKIFDETKKNVLIYLGELKKNGITTAGINLLNNIDLKKRRYYVVIFQESIKSNISQLEKLPNGVTKLFVPENLQYSITEFIAWNLYHKHNINNSFTRKNIKRLCLRNISRFFGNAEFASAIEYEGYGKKMVHLFGYICENTSIFVHNNMVEELSSKDIQHELTLKSAYNSYRNVAIVTSDLEYSTKSISGSSKNIKIVNNFHDYKLIKEKSLKPIIFDEETISNIGVDELKNILNCSAKKIISIGRFSAEKGHDLLIEAFSKFNKIYPDSYLIIIGGYGNLYKQTIDLVNKSKACDRIVVIKSLSNPMPILKKCDLFVLSSRYEGLGLTVLEADTLGIPIVANDVCGPRGFMTEHNGYLTEPSSEGIYDGMIDFVNGNVHAMNVDFEQYNINALSQFEELMN